MNGPKPYILVVDDLPDAADSMAAALVLWGYDAKPRYCGASALIAARLRRPAAVLLDIAMPFMNGFDFAARFRELPGCDQTAVIVISGYTSELYQARGRELGIVHYLFKPADPCQVHDLLKRLVVTRAPRARGERPSQMAMVEGERPPATRRGECGRRPKRCDWDASDPAWSFSGAETATRYVRENLS
jgi:DNA-binding response OmpR family regulator